MIIEASLLLVAGIDLPPSVLGIAFAALNLVAFALFGIDKRRAARKEWRIPSARCSCRAWWEDSSGRGRRFGSIATRRES